MKELVKMMVKDYQEEGFTKKEFFVYGIIMPTVSVCGCILAELLNI